MASPQKARAKSGAFCWALRKCSAASSYSKLWSCAKPWRKSACAAAGPEFRKATSPKSCCALADAEHRSSRIDSREEKVAATLLIVAPLSESDLAQRGAFSAEMSFLTSKTISIVRPNRLFRHCGADLAARLDGVVVAGTEAQTKGQTHTSQRPAPEI